jgi:hypothetical protein
MARIDPINLLLMCEENTRKIIIYLENGYDDRALVRARKLMHAIDIIKNTCVEMMDTEIQKRI